MAMQQIFEYAVPLIEAKIGYVFKDKNLLCQAFTRESYVNEHRQQNHRDPRLQSNEVLEFFGDGVLSAAVISLFIRDFSVRSENGVLTALTEGQLSNMKAKLTDKKNLSRSIEKSGLQQFLLMSEGDKKLGIENQPSVMEDLFESILGAVFIDSGKSADAVMGVVSMILDFDGYAAKNGFVQSYKNALQEYCADKKRRLPPPAYETVEETGPDHAKIYTRVCTIGENYYGTGVGKNLKIADEEAAKNTLSLLTKN